MPLSFWLPPFMWLGRKIDVASTGAQFSICYFNVSRQVDGLKAAHAKELLWTARRSKLYNHRYAIAVIKPSQHKSGSARAQPSRAALSMLSERERDRDLLHQSR